MKHFLMRLNFRRARPRVWIGVVLIAVSIAGTVTVISLERQGAVVVLAQRFLPAGTVIEADDVVEARLANPPLGFEPRNPDVIGKRLSQDVGTGEILSDRVFDSTASPRRLVTIPLDVQPSRALKAGTRVQLWTVSPQESSPPVMVAVDAVVVAVRDGGFGQTGLMDVSITAREEIAVVSALGSEATLVAVMGGDAL